MEFDIVNNLCKLYFNEKIYPLKVIMKAGYAFIETFYIYFENMKNDKIIIEFSSKNNMTDSEYRAKIGEFYNELLHQKIRYDIYLETKATREIVLGRALFGTTINTNSFESLTKNESDDYKLDTNKIGVDWFKNE